MVTPQRKCPACNAELETGSVECMYCGSQVVQVALSFQEREEVNRLVKRLNAQLSAEHADHQRLMDILLITIWSLGVLLIFTLWLVFDWSYFWIVLGGFLAAFFVFREILKRSYLQRRYYLLYLKDIEPQIRLFLLERNIPRWQFDQMADFALPEDAPMRRFLASKMNTKQ